MDSEYLKTTVGDVLAKGIAETVCERPEDPVEYLAQYLLKSVADDKAAKYLATVKDTQAKAAAAAEEAAAKAAKEAEELAAAQSIQTEKEDKRFANLMEGATSSEEVFNAVLNYARARTGANGYIMMTDLPEKIMPPKPPEPADGEEAAAPADGEAEGEAPAAAEGDEPPPPPPKFAPQQLTYVAATAGDETLLVGQTLSRPAVAEEGDDGAATGPADGEGVSFTAIDDFYSGLKVYHEPSAIENRAVKFFYLPRLGGYACAPFEDFEGDALGCLGFDTLGLERAFTPEEVELIGSLAAQTSERLTAIEQGICEQHHTLTAALEAAYPKGEDGAYPTYAAAEGCDPIEAALGALGVPSAVLATLTDANLKLLETRRSVSPGMLSTLKGVLALTSEGGEGLAADLAACTWAEVKAAINIGEAKWGNDLFASLGAFDVMGGAGAGGWDVAAAMVTELTTAPEDGGAAPKDALAESSLLGKLLCDWLLAAVELHAKKAEKDEADAAAAAAAAAEADAAPAEEPAVE